MASIIVKVARSAALLGAVLVVLGAAARQTSLLDGMLIFFPKRELAGDPGDLGLAYEDVFFEAADGVRLHGWFVPGRGDNVLLWFHGNAGNIGHRLDNILMLHRLLGTGVFIFDYRGYRRSDGSPSEKGMYKDAEAAIAYLRSTPGFDSETQLIIFGRSLGSAVAVEMATRHDARGVILESPFTSIRAMAKLSNPLLSSVLPFGAVVRSRFDSLSKIGEVRSPVMVLHGDRDELIPIEVGRELYDAAGEPKRFYTIKGAAHNDTYVVGGEAYFNALAGFIDDPRGNHVTGK
ncbi:MAG: alpha/beta hydrolase [Chloroflexi bacterium]|nr:alpha/beta hydrolase [Chloroflexota bacterium]